MSSSRSSSKLLVGFIGTVCALSFLLVVHNYALNLLPRLYLPIESADILPDSDGSDIAFVFPFTGSTPDGPYHARSRVIFYENDIPQPAHIAAASVRAVGRFNWAHEPGRIVFSSSNNTDPRINNCRYYVSYPILYQRWIGFTALALLVLSSVALYRLHRPPTDVSSTVRGGSRFGSPHLGAATLVFLGGLYFSTGTLAPYANTSLPYVDPQTGYLYNPDHVHFRAMFDFVDGADRSTWDGALFLRRILYNVIAYPFMKATPQWEIGGTLAAIALNLAGFLLFVRAVRRDIGPRGAIFAAWALAFYPGAAYWVGLPYSHVLIAPISLLLMLGLNWMWRDQSRWPLVAVSLELGVANLGYDFFVNFLPASLLLLLWQRRWVGAGVSLVLQLVPMALWLATLKYGFDQPMLNSNTGSFGAIAGSYLNIKDFPRWLTILAAAPEIGFDVFFGANFIFLPIAFTGILVLNGVTSRSQFHGPEIALLASGLAFYLFNNLAPDYVSTWQMRGPWISRLYQPIFPAMILFGARWWQELPACGRILKATILAFLTVCSAGSSLVIFGSALNNPLRLAETAFYRFYDHANHVMFEVNLRNHGRRPLGFPRPQADAKPAP